MCMHRFLEVMAARVFTAPLCDGGDFHGGLSLSFQFLSRAEVDDIPGNHCQQCRDLEHEVGAQGRREPMQCSLQLCLLCPQRLFPVTPLALWVAD